MNLASSKQSLAPNVNSPTMQRSNFKRKPPNHSFPYHNFQPLYSFGENWRTRLPENRVSTRNVKPGYNTPTGLPRLLRARSAGAGARPGSIFRSRELIGKLRRRARAAGRARVRDKWVESLPRLDITSIFDGRRFRSAPEPKIALN